MKNRLSTIEYYQHTSDVMCAYQTKWIGVFNRPMALNRLIEENVP